MRSEHFGCFHEMAVIYSIDDPYDALEVHVAIHRLLGSLSPPTDLEGDPRPHVRLGIVLEKMGSVGPVRLDDVSRSVSEGAYTVGSHAFRGEVRKLEGGVFDVSVRVEPDAAKMCAALRVLFASLVVHFDMLYLHAGSMSYRERAWVFVGPAGAGKTTVTRGIVDHLGRSRFMDDDLTFLFTAGGRPHASLDPFECDKVKMRVQDGHPLGAIFFLAGRDENRIVRLSAAAAAARIAAEAMNTYEYAEQTRDVLRVTEQIAGSVPVYDTWSCNDEAFMEMLGGKIEEMAGRG